MARADRTAYPRLPHVPLPRELNDVFIPTAEEVAWAATRVTTGRWRLGLVVLLKCCQRLGYFPQLDQVPEAVVDHVSPQAQGASDERFGPDGRSAACGGQWRVPAAGS